MTDSLPQQRPGGHDDSGVTRIVRSPADQSTGPKRDSSTEDKPANEATRSFVPSSVSHAGADRTASFDPNVVPPDQTLSFQAGKAPSGENARPMPTRIGPYQIVDILGRGGMGIVYKAWHPTIKRFAAIKMILSGHFAEQSALERFQVEAQAAAALDHPSIVKLYEIGSHDGLPFFALEFVDGRPLSTVVAGTPMEPERAARITARLLSLIHI